MSGPIWVMFCNQTTHHTPKYTDNKPTFRFYTKAKTNYSLPIRNGSVVLAPTNSSDPHQDLFQHHGEHGAIVADIQPVDLVVSHVLNRILSSETSYVPIKRGSRVVLMINGLGATPVMELMIAAGKVVPILQLEHGLAVVRVYTGSFMTSLDMAGFSISIMKSEQAILQRLDAATKAPHWHVGVDGDHPPAKIPIPVQPSRSTKSDEVLSRPEQLNEQGRALELAIEAAVSAIIDLKDSLNEWDSKVGDGDCGSTMSIGATAIQ